MGGIACESLLRRQVRQSCRLWIAGVIALMPACPLLAAEPATTRPTQTRVGQTRAAGGGQPSARPASVPASGRTPARSPKVDHAVTPAGGMPTGQAQCSQCQRSACPQCRLAESQHRGHGQCQHGLCPAHCPVRPDVFGFYGTRWRRWPGSGVVQASNDEAATPVRPPRAEVPGVAEESFEPDAAAEDLPAPAAEDRPSEPEQSEPAEPAAKAPPAVDPQSALRPASDAEAAAVDDPRGDEPEGEAASTEQAGEPSRERQDEVVSRTAWRTFTATPPRLTAWP
jgi:hypothetical protein